MPDILDQIAAGTYRREKPAAAPPPDPAGSVLDRIASGTYERAGGRGDTDPSRAIPDSTVAYLGGWDPVLRRLAKEHGLTVTSAHRSPARQMQVNPGAPGSYHTSGDWNRAGALDIAGDPARMRKFYAAVREQYPQLAESFLNLGQEWQAFKRGRPLARNPEAGRAAHVHLAWDQAVPYAPKIAPKIIGGGKPAPPPVLPPNLPFLTPPAGPTLRDVARGIVNPRLAPDPTQQALLRPNSRAADLARAASGQRAQEAEGEARVSGPQAFNPFTGDVVRRRNRGELGLAFLEGAFASMSQAERQKIEREYRDRAKRGEFAPVAQIRTPEEKARVQAVIPAVRDYVAQAAARLQEAINDPGLGRGLGRQQYAANVAAARQAFLDATDPAKALSELKRRGVPFDGLTGQAARNVLDAARYSWDQKGRVVLANLGDLGVNVAASAVGGQAGRLAEPFVGKVASPLARAVLGPAIEGAAAGAVQQPATRALSDRQATPADLLQEALFGAVGGGLIGGGAGALSGLLHRTPARVPTVAEQLAADLRRAEPRFPSPTLEPKAAPAEPRAEIPRPQPRRQPFQPPGLRSPLDRPSVRMEAQAPRQAPDFGPIRKLPQPAQVLDEIAEGRYKPAETPTAPAAPPSPKPSLPRASTGLANQVQQQEALAGLLRNPEKAAGKSAAAFQEIGKALVQQGQDPDAVAARVAAGKVGITAEDFGVLLEGKRRKLQALNRLRDELDDAVKNGAADVAEKRAAYERAQADLQTYLDRIQQGKGKWSDIGRALQAGTEIDTGNYAEVLAEAKRRGVAVDDLTVRRLTAEVKQHAERAAELEATVKRLEAEEAARAVRPDVPAPEVAGKGFRVTFRGEIELPGKRISGTDAEDLSRLMRAIEDGDVSALRQEWGDERFAHAVSLGDELEAAGAADAPKAYQEWRRARDLWERGQLDAEWADTRRREALTSLHNTLAQATKRAESYFADAVDAKGRPLKKVARYREFNTETVPENERREIVRMLLEGNPSLADKEWTIPGFGKGGLESLVVDAGILPEEVAVRYANLQPGGGRGPRVPGAAATPNRFQARRATLRTERTAIIAEIEALANQAAGGLHDVGSVAYDAARFGAAVGRLALNYAAEGVVTLEEIAVKVLDDLKTRGIRGATEQDVVDALVEASRTEPRPRSEKANLLGRLKNEARQIVRTREQVEQLKGGTALPQGPPRPTRPATGRLGELRAERDALLKARREVQSSAAAPARATRTQEQRLAEINRQIAELERQAAQGTADPAIGPPKLRQKRQELEEALALRDRAKRKVQAYLEQQRPKTALERLSGPLNTVRGTILGSDVGVVTRQGLFAWSHPVTAGKAVARGVRSALSETNLAKFERELAERRVNGKLAALERKRAGLQVTDTLTEPEELLVARIMKRVPGVGRLAGGLERFQTTFINSVRADLFDDALRAGWTPEELKLRAQFINASTGRGDVRMIPKFAQLLLTSPRYEASRWEVLAAPFKNAAIAGADLATGKGVNRAALTNLRDMGVTAAGVLTTFKLAELAGYRVNWDPRSADFLKMRKGDEVWDVTAGLAPRLRDLLRIYVAWENGPERGKTIQDILGAQYARALSPAVRTPLEQTSLLRQRAKGIAKPKLPVSGFPEDERQGVITLAPLIVQSIREAWMQGGPGAAAWTGAREFIGQGVNRYPERKGRN